MRFYDNLGFSWNHPTRKFFRSRKCDPVLDTVGGSFLFLGVGLILIGMFRLILHPWSTTNILAENRWCDGVVMSLMIPGMVFALAGTILFGDFKSEIEALVEHLGEDYDIQTLTRTDLVPLKIMARVRLIDLAGQLKFIEEATTGLTYHKSRVEAKAKFEECYSFFEKLGLTYDDGYGRYFEPSLYAWD